MLRVVISTNAQEDEVALKRNVSFLPQCTAWSKKGLLDVAKSAKLIWYAVQMYELRKYTFFIVDILHFQVEHNWKKKKKSMTGWDFIYQFLRSYIFRPRWH